jgi:Bacterial archaeo-eukaryotic release factor family 7
MNIIGRDELRTLMEKRDFFCASIYMPAFRTMPDAKQNPIRFKNLLKQMETRLEVAGLTKSAAREFSRPAKALAGDRLFWQYQSGGFAAFMTSHSFRYYRLPGAFKELLVITDRFHIKPLLQLCTEDQRFHILALSLNDVRFFQCSRHSISEVQLKSAPGSLSQALKNYNPERQLQFHTKTPGARGNRAAIYHGHGMGKDQAKNNILKFFQQVDRGLRKTLNDESSPLVLAGVDYLFPIYHEANSYPNLLPQGIPGNPEGLKLEWLQKKAWRIAEPCFLKAREKATAQYKQLVGSPRASSDVEKIALAAHQGRIDVLFTAVGIQRWGAFDSRDLSIVLHKRHRPGDEDLLDYAAVHTLWNGGTVYAVKPGEMPDRVPMAAIYRF